MSDRPTINPDSDIYTVLLIVATIIVISGTVFTVMRAQALFGLWNPFTQA